MGTLSAKPCTSKPATVSQGEAGVHGRGLRVGTGGSSSRPGGCSCTARGSTGSRGGAGRLGTPAGDAAQVCRAGGGAPRGSAGVTLCP